MFLFVFYMAHHRARFPHAYHLVALSCDPSWNRHGIGAKVLKAGLDRADSAEKGCYVSCTNSKAVFFLMRSNFRVVEKLYPFSDDHRVSGRGQLVVLMYRKARSE